MQRYAKAIVAGLLALFAWGVTASADEVYEQKELWGLGVAVVTAAGVYAVPNKPPAGEEPDPAMSE